MNTANHQHLHTRRSMLGTTASTGLLAGLSRLAAFANTDTGTGGSDDSNYKALVCIFLKGGLDTNHLLVPKTNPAGDAPKQRDLYETHRAVNNTAVLQLEENKLRKLTHDNETHYLGLHESMENMQDLYTDGKLAFVANVGPLVEPVANYDAYKERLNSSRLPPKIASHSDQQRQWMSSWPDRPFISGWGGRLADAIYPVIGTPSGIPLSISMPGNDDFLIGLKDHPFSMNKAVSKIIRQTYIEPQLGPSTHLLKAAYADAFKRSISLTVNISEILKYSELSNDKEYLFKEDQQLFHKGLSTHLQNIAKLIDRRKEIGNPRQIFYAAIGGFDNHSDQAAVLEGDDENDGYLAQIDKTLNAFHQTLDDLGVKNQVTTFLCTDFGRTLVPNSGAGTDHAWGAHPFVFGGAVKGGKVYGEYPSLDFLDGNAIKGNSRSYSTRGNWIPSTSVDQYGAVLADWFLDGIYETSARRGPGGVLHTIFPNLHRFSDPFDSSINFMNV